MAIPGFQSYMLPLLELASDGEVHTSQEAYDAMAERFGISDEERQQLLPSGGQPLFNNRVAWALTYLRQAGLVESPKRGRFRLTDEGRHLLAREPEKITIKTLEEYPAFLEFKHRTSSRSKPKREKGKPEHWPQQGNSQEAEADTPEDALVRAWQAMGANLEAELLDQVKASSPTFFERVVLDLIVGMGYGGNRADAGRSVQRSKDEGIDGVINEDRLGLEVIYLQAKRWEGVVGRPDIQKFAGALQGKRARKGVFLTTSSFSREAEDYADSIDSRIVLIDGERLASLMVEHDVGVALGGTYPVKRIDSDYFVED